MATRTDPALARQRPLVATALVALLLVGATFVASAGRSAASTIVVVLDPGHGGADPGAVGGGIIERDSNLDMALRVRAILLDAGVDVVMTRMTEGRAEGLDTSRMGPVTASFADLQARVRRANAANANVFVSLHSNSFWDPAASGVEAWYDAARPFGDRNRALADLMHAEVIEELRRTGFAGPMGRARDGVRSMDAQGRTTPYFVIGPSRDVSRGELAERGVDPAAIGLAPGASAYRTHETGAPGVILELLYLSNPDDVALLRNDTARHAMARGIARAILIFLGIPDGLSVA